MDFDGRASVDGHSATPHARAHQIADAILPWARAAWVADVLGASMVGLPVPADVSALTDPELDFVEAAAIFHRLRQSTLQGEEADGNRLGQLVLLAAENAAKVIADPWGERFNRDAAGWFWICIEDLLEARSNDALSSAVSQMLGEVTASTSVDIGAR